MAKVLIEGKAKTSHVKVNGRLLSAKPSQALMNHSPDGFAWGYGGSGPAQLALAILYDVTNDRKVSLAHYQNFKWDVIAGLPEGDFSIEVDVEEKIAGYEAGIGHTV